MLDSVFRGHFQTLPFYNSVLWRERPFKQGFACCIFICVELPPPHYSHNEAIQETGGTSVSEHYLFASVLCRITFLVQCSLGIISSSCTKAKPFISLDPFVIIFYKTMAFYLASAFQIPGHIAWDNKHWSYHCKASFLALPAKLFFWGNVCRQDAPPFPS